MNVQVIYKNGKPELAIIPYHDYLLLVEQAEMLDDIQSFDKAKVFIENGDDEIIPAAVANALAGGENPIKVWRIYRQLSQLQVAEKLGISVSLIRHLETRKRKVSIDVMRKLALLLNVDFEDLL